MGGCPQGVASLRTAAPRSRFWGRNKGKQESHLVVLLSFFDGLKRMAPGIEIDKVVVRSKAQSTLLSRFRHQRRCFEATANDD
jgi:hypothetical protein